MSCVHVDPLLLAVLFTLALAGCSNNDDPPAPAPMQPAPAPAPTPGDTFGLTSANRLVTFNRAAPAVRTAVAITGLQSGEQLLGIDIRPGGMPAGELYALGSTGRVYTINITSGAATQKSQLAADSTDATNPFTALDGTDFGVDFNPVVDRLRVVSNTGQNLRINVDTGATTTDDALNSAGATRTGISATAYTNSFAAACRTTLFYIDTTTDSLLTTTDPNAGTLTELGSLGVNADASSGYEIVTAADGTNSAIAVLTVGGATTLYTINPPTVATPAATAVGAVTGLNTGETLRGIAAASIDDRTDAGSGLGARRDGNEQADLLQQRHTAEAVHVGCRHRLAERRERPRHRHASGGRRRVRSRQHGPHLHDRRDHCGRDAQVDAGRGRGGYDQSVHGARRQRVRRRLQPRTRSPARREQHESEPAHQRRHGRDDDGYDAESRRRGCDCSRLHEQLRGRWHDDAVRVRCRKRSLDDPGSAVRQPQQRRPASGRPAGHRRAGLDRLRHQRRQQRRLRGCHARRGDHVRAAHDQSHEWRSDARQRHRRRRARARPDVERESASDAARRND